VFAHLLQAQYQMAAHYDYPEICVPTSRVWTYTAPGHARMRCLMIYYSYILLWLPRYQIGIFSGNLKNIVFSTIFRIGLPNYQVTHTFSYIGENN
jgi:hypothetical protein